jgi:hypothetical protein
MSASLTAPNYTDHEKGFFITEAVVGLDAINNGIAYVATGVKNDQYVVPVLTANPKLNPRTLLPVDNSTTVLSNKVIQLGAFEAYELFDPNVFENHWHSSELADKLLTRGLPSTFSNYLGGFYTQKTFVPVGNMIHIGSTTYTTSAALPADVNYSHKYFDGLIKQALNVSTPALQVATPIALTSANIISKMEAAKALMPKALLSKANRYARLKFIMSVEDIEKYEEALTSTTYKNNDTTEAGIRKYKGYSIVSDAGLPENTFYFCEAATDVNSNIHMPVTSMENLTFELNRLQNNSSAWFYKAIAKMGVAIAKPTEFVIYTTKTLANFNA